MKLDGSSSTLLVKNLVTKIEHEGTDVVAYANNTEIYREAIQDAPPDVQQINQLIKRSNKLVFVSKDFKTHAEEVISLYNNLTATEQLLVPIEIRSKITMIQEWYKKMQELSFNETTAWAAEKLVAEAKKKWTVQLSQEVLNTTENLKYIELVDMFGDRVDAAIQVNGKTITVTPTANYVESVVYTLVIKPGLKNVNGQKLEKGVHLQFKVQTK